MPDGDRDVGAAPSPFASGAHPAQIGARVVPDSIDRLVCPERCQQVSDLAKDVVPSIMRTPDRSR